MILLDTNVISEMMKPQPSEKMMKWINNEEVSQLFISTITIAEISYGIQSLPNGKRKLVLQEAFDKAIQENFKHRIVAFNEEATHYYGEIMSHKKKRGTPMSILDGQIAAIARSLKANIATRNIRDFDNCHLDLINPFD